MQSELNGLVEEDSDAALNEPLHAPAENLPTTVDWREQGMVTPVQRQVSEEDGGRERH